MTLSRKQLGRLISACAVGLASLSGAAVSHAEQAHRVDGESSVRCEGQLVAALVVGNRGRLEIPVFPTMATLVVFQHRIKQVRQGKKSEISASIFQDKVLMVMPSPAARPGMVVEVNVHANPTRQTLYFRVTGDPEAATVAASIMEREPDTGGRAYTACVPIDSSLALATMVADKDARIDEMMAQIDELKAQSDKQAEERARAEALLAVETTRDAERRILTELIKAREAAPPADDDDIRGKRGVFIRHHRWEVVGDMHFLHVDIYNNDPRAFRVGAVRAHDELAEQNLAAQVKIGKEDGPQTATRLGTLAPYSRVPAALLVTPGVYGDHLTLSMRESNGERTITSESIPTWTWKQPREENEGKMSVDLQAVYGAIWLANPLDKEQLDPTSLAGLGARITYGLSKRLSFEAEVMGAQTGEACFQTMNGELMRSAVIGRAQGGLLARFGQDRYRPFVRLGLGLQGASHTAEMLNPDGSRMPGPDVELTFDVTAAFGGGLDIRLGESFMAGVGLSALLVAKSATAQPTSSISIEAGFRLGYSWKP